MGGALPRLVSPESTSVGVVLAVRSLEREEGGGRGQVGTEVEVSVAA
jgi:hypothetical protein